MANLLELAGYVQKQGELGRQRGEQSRLASLASQAYTAPRADRQGLLGQMAQTSPGAAVAQQKLFRQGDSDRMADLSRKAKLFVGMAETGNAQAVAALYPQIAQEARDLGLGDIPMEYNDTFLPGLKKFASILDDGQASEVGVQSTYVDSQGNRVAILRDGSTRTLGQNAPNNQIIDTGNGFYGVNKSSLAAAPVMVGGGRPTPQIPAGGMFTGPDGMPTRIDPSLPPAVQQAIMADPNAWNAAPDGASAQLPPQQTGAQLRSAPKETAQETFSQPQAVTGPDGQIRYVQFGNRGGTREVQGYSAPPTDRDAKPPTEGERKAATLLKRLTGSLAQLEQAVRESPEAASPSLAAEAARRLPFVGDAAANTITPAARQRVEAAQLDILDAALTLGTGAAYTREQLEGYRRSFFPQIGDSEATIRDKSVRLNNVIEAARIAAGRANPDNPERAAPAATGGWKIERVD